jgi:hypothetical protein
MTCDIFIRSYWKDLDWLHYCLASIAKNCSGFQSVILVMPESSKPWLRRASLPKDVRIEFCQNYKDDYLGQQVTKLFADTLSDADYICHFDSDCLLSRPIQPEDVILDGRPFIFMRSNAALGRHWPWQKPTEKFVGWSVAYDFMQRPPFIFPRWLYPRLRQHAVTAHGTDIASYVLSQPARNFSEYNALGAFAFRHYPERFRWVDVDRQTAGEPFCRWFWSWGGLDRATRAQIDAILGSGPEAAAAF